jgi:signal transduction histidine kinase/CheY-like chemotaxis protein
LVNVYGQQPQPWFLRSALRFHASIALTLALPACALYVFVRSAAHNELERSAVQHGLLATTLVGDVVGEQILGLKRHVQSYAALARLRNAVKGNDLKEVGAILAQLVEANPLLYRAFITDSRGVLQADFPPDPSVKGVDFSHRDWYLGAGSMSGVYVSRAHRRTALQAPLAVTISTRIEDDNGSVLGYLVAQYALADLQKWIGSLKPLRKGNIYVLDQGGFLLNSGAETGEPSALRVDGTIKSLAEAGSGWAQAFDPLSGKKSIVSVKRIDSLGWTVIGCVPVDTVFAGANALSKGMIVLFVLGLAGSTWLGAKWRRTLLNYDRMRIVAEEELRQANDSLEQTVDDRTRELQEANEALRREAEMRTHAEEQLLHSQKLESIGRLAGGIAHDFNNHLTPILGFASLMEATLDEGDPNKDYARHIAKAAERAALLTKQLLSVARKQVIQPIPLNINEVIRNAEPLLDRTVGEDVELVVKLESNAWPVMMDPGQFEQILLNLVVNARDAMPRGGTLLIETMNVDLTEQYALSCPDVPPGGYVMLGVSDSGEGMDSATLARVFEPFFTTKEHGTGLGLATTYGLVKQLGGHIWAYSEPGKGTTFKIYFPRTAKEPSAIENTEATEAVSGTLTGSETVLVVEDEDQVREIVGHILRGAGYSVIECQNPEDAISRAGSPGATIDLLITDVVMPKTSGVDLSRRIQEFFPGLKVLFMSGYTESSIAHHGVLEAGMSCLSKPFTPGDLLRMVRQVLDDENGGPPRTTDS